LGIFSQKTAVFDRIYRIFQDFRPKSLLPQRSQRGKAATKLIRTHELMKMERGISRKTGNAGKQDRLRAIPEMN
jgi:hypothetical protein